MIKSYNITQNTNARFNRNFELNRPYGRVHWVHRSSFPPDRELIRARKHDLGPQTCQGNPSNALGLSRMFGILDDNFGPE